jgi:small subunit ribosomal protein S7
MSRRSIVKKNYPASDSKYKSFLLSLLIGRILKKGKKQRATSIIIETFTIIKKKTNNDPLHIFESALKRLTPHMEVKGKKIGGSTYQVPVPVSPYRGIILALSWLLKAAVTRSIRTTSLKLANEIIDASKGIGNAVRKCDEIHSMAKANKAFAHYQ